VVKSLEDSEGPIVYLRRAADGDEVAVKLEEFEELVKAGQVNPRTRVRFDLVTGEHWVAAEELEIFSGLYSLERIAFQEQFNLRRFPLVTALFVVVNVVVFLFVQHARIWYGVEAPLVLGAKAAPLIEEAGQLWRLLTFNFVHADRFHLLSNMAFVLILGLALENAFSRRSYLVIMTSSAICSGIASYLLTVEPSAGASGVVFGILGALVVFGIKYHALIPRPYTYYFGWSLLPLLLVTIYAGLTQPLVDNWGHLGGLAGGVVSCALLEAEVLENKAVTVSGWAIAGASFVVLVAVLVFGAPIVTWLTNTPRTFRDELGLSLQYPSSWDSRGYDDFGYVLVSHSAYPYIQMTLGSIERDGSVDAGEALDRRLRLEVLDAEQRGELDSVSQFRRRRLRIDGHPAEMASYTFRVERRRCHRVVYIITRGNTEHMVSLSTLEAWRDPYARVFADVVSSIRITEE
jgi:membrane associated rhomboid family serine protease